MTARRIRIDDEPLPLDSALAAAMYGLAPGSEAFEDRVRQMARDRGENADLPQLSQMGILHVLVPVNGTAVGCALSINCC